MISRQQLFGALFLLPAMGLPGVAQQPLPRPIVLYRPPVAAQPVRPGSTLTARPSPSTAGSRARPATLVFGSAANPQSAQPALNNGQQGQQAGGAGQSGEKSATDEQTELQSRPTNPMLQNPSGAFNMTHTGITSNQQMAPNLYFGQQFQTWTNQQPVAQMPASFGEMNRFQPGPFGGYVGPNTYLGSGFSNWSNLSQGSVTPGATGSWGFSVWP